MKKMMLLLAVGFMGLMLASPAQAQFYSRYPAPGATTVGVYTPNWGFTYSAQPAVVVPAYRYDVYPRPYPVYAPVRPLPYPYPVRDCYVPRPCDPVPTPYNPVYQPVPRYYR